MYTVTVTVADFTAAGPVPAGAYATVARATVDTSGTVVVSTERQIVRLPGGVGTFQAEPGVAYRFHLAGVTGFTDPWYFVHTADVSAAELYQHHQVDPATLAPAPIPPSTQALLDAANSVLTQVQQYGFAVAADGADVDALQITYPDQMIDPADPDAIVFTTGA